MSTTLQKTADIERKWYIVDATDKPAGRLATQIATVIRGKHKPTYTPYIDSGDFVIVINAKKVKLTGSKEETKIYKDFSGYPSGLKERKASVIRETNPTRIVAQAVKGMLPNNRLCRGAIKRLKVYAGSEHPHAAQQPEQLKLK